MCSRADEEISALKSIYELEFEETEPQLVKQQTRSKGTYESICRVVRYRDETLTVKLAIPETYINEDHHQDYKQEESDVTVIVIGLTFHSNDCQISQTRKAKILSNIDDIIRNNEGQETLYDVIEYLRGQSYLSDGGGREAEMVGKEIAAADAVVDCQVSDHFGGAPSSSGTSNGIAVITSSSYSSSSSSSNSSSSIGGDIASNNNNHNTMQYLEIIHGEATFEKKSSFQSHLAFVTSMAEVNAFRTAVVEDKRFARATHNIFAYRFICPMTGISYHDNDDDGESAAGGRLAELLRLMNANGVAVIVSRWFGGILLGPDRFKFILNSARRLLEDHGVGSGGGAGAGGSGGGDGGKRKPSKT